MGNGTAVKPKKPVPHINIHLNVFIANCVYAQGPSQITVWVRLG